MSEKLSAADARILALESDVVMGHALKLMVLAPGDPLDLARLRATVAARLDRYPRATDRVRADAGGPVWVRSESFEIADHVQRWPGSAGASPADVRGIVGELMSEHLDRTAPLWRFDVIGPLADGREAIAARMHHAMVDGVSAVRFLDTVLWEPHDAPVHPGGSHPSPPPLSRWGEWERLPGALAREFGRPGSRSPFDKPITNRRALAFTDLSLAELKALGGSRPKHATVNDVLLTVIAGGLRRWLGHDGRSPHLRAQIPVSLHREGESAVQTGNNDSFLNVDLALREPDDLRRLDAISAQTRLRKRRDDAAVVDDVMRSLDRLGPAGMLVERLASGAREFSVAISNVPGPRMPVSVAGRRVERLYTSSEPADHHALRISAISSGDGVGVGFSTDPAVVTGIEDLAQAVHDAYEVLRAAAPAP